MSASSSQLWGFAVGASLRLLLILPVSTNPGAPVGQLLQLVVGGQHAGGGGRADEQEGVVRRRRSARSPHCPHPRHACEGHITLLIAALYSHCYILTVIFPGGGARRPHHSHPGHACEGNITLFMAP